MRAVAVGLTLQDIGYLRDLWANKADAEAAVARARRADEIDLARDALRNADSFWAAFGVPLILSAIDVAERTLMAAGDQPDTRRAHAVVLTADSARPGNLARELRALAGKLEGFEVV